MLERWRIALLSVRRWPHDLGSSDRGARRAHRHQQREEVRIGPQPLDRRGLVARTLTEAMVAGYLDVFPDGPTVGLVEAHTGRTWAEAKG